MAVTVVSNLPASNETDVILMTTIQAVFSAAVTSGSVNADTFVVYSTGTTVFKEAGGSLSKNSDLYKYADTDYVEGTYTYLSGSAASGFLNVTFTPTKPLKPNVEYTVILTGYDQGTKNANKYIRTVGGDYLSRTVKWKFTTGELMVDEPPSRSTEISYLDMLAEIGLAEEQAANATYVVSPAAESVNVTLVDDTLFTFTFNDHIVTPVTFKVTVKNLDDPLREEIEIPATYEVENGNILRIKFQ